MDGWADDHGVQLYFIDPGKPTQNAYIESFNGRYREECRPCPNSWCRRPRAEPCGILGDAA